jgi:hypothetical protein
MSTFDFSGLVDLESFGNFAELPLARHTTAPTWTRGTAGPTGWTATTIECAAWPLDPTSKEVLPEGARERGAIVLYTRVVIYGERMGSRTTGRRGDVVQWQGRIWQVAEVQDYSQSGGFWEAIAVRMDRAEATVADFVTAEAA